MDYEKKYKEALEKARQLCAYPVCKPFISDLQDLFTELKESEDEKTKRLLHTIANKMSQHLCDIFTEEEFQCFDAWSNAWLEKYCEQKPILDVEIPFGAKDSELEEVSYSIPNGYHAEIEDNKVIIKKGEQKSSWSEEDEREVDILKAYICSREWSDSHIDRALGIVDELVKKLKSIRPQTTWKPSDEQLDSLYDVLNPCDGFNREVLESLYVQLKKLREE